MDFSVPKEYADFVTSAGDLLNQFNTGSSVLETVSYCIHTAQGDLATAISVLNKASSILEPFVQGYLWHNESFHLVIKVDAGEPVSLIGSTCIGECIEDEWFIVYLLLKLSQDMPHIIVSIVDTDGQFLLMEAADYIDDWIGPENADNRVWLRSGAFYIIPLDEPGKMKSGGMILNRAIKCMLDGNVNQRKFLANDAFHRTIYQRTLQAFPARSLANRHTALCIVPIWLAKLIRANPQIVARAVVEFHAADKDQLRQACASSSVGQYLPNKSTSPTATGAADQTLVLLPVQFTRALYAQLTFKNFHPPRKYHAMMRRMAEASSRKVSQAFDIGCRLACGVDCAYYFGDSISMQQPAAARVVDASNPAWLELLAFAKSQGYSMDKLADLQPLFQTGQISSTANFERSHREESVFPGGFKNFVDSVTSVTSGSDAGCTEILPNDLAETDQRLFRSIIEGTVRGDEDAWLFMTPEELDKEMQTRVDRFAATSTATDAGAAEDAAGVTAAGTTISASSTQGPTGTETSSMPIATNQAITTDEASEEAASAASLQAMLDGFKSFMEGSSDIDGISFGSKPSSKPKKLSTSAVPAVEAKTNTVNQPPLVPGSTAGELQLDYAYLERLMQAAPKSTAMPPPSHSPGTATVSKDEQVEELARVAAEKERADLAGYFSKEDLRPLDSEGEDSDDGSNSDSDDETDDQEGAAAADQYLEAILQQQSVRAAGSHNTATSGIIKDGAQDAGALLGVGGGYIQGNSSSDGSRRRGTSTEVVDSDDEVDYNATNDARWHSSDQEEDEEDEEDEDDEELDEDLIREYQKLMDSELFQDSSLAETFEWTAEGRSGATGTGEDVDIDMNLLKNLMEAQSQGMGSPLAGPLGQLMAQLGIKMPMPPPMKQRP